MYGTEGYSTIRESLWNVFEHIGDDTVKLLRSTIRSGNMAIKFNSAGTFLPAYDDEGHLTDFIGEKFPDSRNAEMHDGVEWLACLYEKETQEANDVTVHWIDRWLEQQAEIRKDKEESDKRRNRRSAKRGQG